MKIAFTSCMAFTVFAQQPVWDQIAAQRPDRLLLLGDSVYIDFGPYPTNITHPKQLAPVDFLQHVLARWRTQLDQPQFRALVRHHQLRTAPHSAPYVQKLLQAKPVRLSRAQLETLAIVAYRQPITRPEIDDIRGVDSGGTLKMLLERGLLRILGKKEEPGRPMLYGTTREFLEFFNLRDLRDLPTLREFYELSEEQRSDVELFRGLLELNAELLIDRHAGHADVLRELVQARIVVDLGRFDLRAVFGVDLAHPGHAGDRIQTEIDELGVLVDIVDAHLQLEREQRFEELGDGVGVDHGGHGSFGGRGRRGRRGRCRLRLHRGDVASGVAIVSATASAGSSAKCALSGWRSGPRSAASWKTAIGADALTSSTVSVRQRARRRSSHASSRP